MEKTIRLGNAYMTISNEGCISSILADTGKELLSKKNQPLFRLHINNDILSPEAMKEVGGKLVFSFAKGYEVTASYREEEGYAVLRVERVKGEIVNLLIGPIFSSLSGEIGDVIGVVRDNGIALGIQALNLFTLPGYPKNCPLPDKSVESTVLSALSVDTLSYYESAAFPFEQGSVLQLFAEERRVRRNKTIMGTKGVEVAAIAALQDYDGSVDGAAFALFCSPEQEALSRIGSIEVGEGLPHPTLEGEWVKTSRKAMAAYLISEFDVGSIDKLLDYTQQAGLTSLYHPEPFSSWGHFTLRLEAFPNGDSSMAECCSKASSRGIRLGVHTLTSFTTTNDKYITPKPESNLATYGSSRLFEDISPDATDLTVEEAQLYETVTTLQTVMVGEELITYSKATNGGITGCVRGAFGTTAACHSKGEQVFLLCDYPYKVFFPNIILQDNYTARLSELFHNTGLSQISFDGLEGCAYTGEDLYGINRFCSQCYDGWGDKEVINDASRLQHNLWHMHTRMNWGEPWGEAMREGQISSRLKNQDFYKRNLFPRMLGWFLIRKANRKFEATSIQDLEWALSKAAGYDAGFALFAPLDVLDTLGITSELLEAVSNWEKIRLSGMLTDEIRTALQDPKSEWHLVNREGKNVLLPLFISPMLTCDLLEMQPGQPGGSDWVYENHFAAQVVSKPV